MDFTEDSSLGNKTNSTSSDDFAKNANDTFKTILVVIIIILIVFLLFFIYNLIKCYLPKWMNQDRNRLQEDNNAIEFDKI